ncbi:TetR/AcrR family transcriptional regulator [Arthrobacter sp. KK5.5]|uniref:TetR/AcrR family transcriptional regulator n=1 Tax=Arthrobacter sp. KK5.5 TaxID=3373084 RepID=UPI003EE54009
MTARQPFPSGRSQAKATRRTTLLAEAARLFALHGYRGVSIEDLGAASGISGPAVYRHFPGKAAVLGALLVGVSEDLLEGGRRVVSDGGNPSDTLWRLVGFHADFALGNPDVIRVHDRELSSLADDDGASVRRLQRAYIDVWAEQFLALHPAEDLAAARFRAQAVFGLMNSTRHSAARGEGPPAPLRARLTSMAFAAACAPVG